jgi:hypothetical protein
VLPALGSNDRAPYTLVWLHSTGLIHRFEEFVFTSPAAVPLWQL